MPFGAREFESPSRRFKVKELGETGKAVIFDWSGVLSDDFEMCFQAEMRVLDALGVKRLPREEYADKFELPYTRFYEKIGLDVPKERIEELFRKGVRECGVKPQPVNGSKEALEYLKGKGFKTAVFSAHPSEFLEKELEEYGFSGLVDVVEAGVFDKTAAVHDLIALLGTKENVLVGDMVHDIEAGKKAGIKTIAVCSQYDSRERLEAAKPDHVIEDLSGLKELL